MKLKSNLTKYSHNIYYKIIIQLFPSTTIDLNEFLIYLPFQEFDTQNNAAADSEAAAQITAQIEKRRVRKKKSQASKYTGSD